MTALKRVILVGCLAAASASTASAQYLPNFSGMAIGLTADLPVGKLDEIVKTGYGISLRSGADDNFQPWSGRSSFTFDRFAGNGTYDYVQFVAIGGDLVHHSSENFYQFAGLALQNTRFVVRQGNASTAANNKSEQDIGLDGGVGITFGSGDGLKGFVEFSAMSVLTSGASSSWFPIRIGLRF